MAAVNVCGFVNIFATKLLVFCFAYSYSIKLLDNCLKIVNHHNILNASISGFDVVHTFW
jgi:hypothetical protein